MKFCKNIIKSYHSTSLLNRQSYNLAGDGPKSDDEYTLFQCWNIRKQSKPDSRKRFNPKHKGCPLNIMHWNSQGYNLTKRNELSIFAQERNIDVLCVSEIGEWWKFPPYAPMGWDIAS